MVTTSFKLNNGLQMPALGLGTSLITASPIENPRGPNFFHGGGGAIRACATKKRAEEKGNRGQKC